VNGATPSRVQIGPALLIERRPLFEFRPAASRLRPRQQIESGPRADDRFVKASGGGVCGRENVERRRVLAVRNRTRTLGERDSLP
jgi:hypothetical protein